MFLFFASFFSLWPFSPWVPVPNDRMFVGRLLPSPLKTTAHVICFLCSFSGHGFPLPGPWQSWQAGDSVAVREGGSGGQSSAGVHTNDTWCPSHLWWCKRCPVPGKAEEQGGRGCLKYSSFWKTWLRVQQGGKAQSPAAGTVGVRRKWKQHSGRGWTEKSGMLTVADQGTAGFTDPQCSLCL